MGIRARIPTKAGINLVTVLPELLTSPKLTADWEQRLNEVAKGQASPEDFMDGIEEMAAELVKAADLIILAGGPTLAQNRFFQEVRLREAMADFGGVVLGISAGTMNTL